MDTMTVTIRSRTSGALLLGDDKCLGRLGGHNQVPHLRRVVARQPHRARLHEAVEEPARLGELAQQRGVRVHAHLRLVVPLQGVAASERFDSLRTCGLFCAMLPHVVRSFFIGS